MNVQLEGALAPATPPAGETAQRRHGSWRQAMEQAQLAEWFQPGRGRAGGDEPGGTQAQAAARASARQPQARELGLRHALHSGDAGRPQERVREQVTDQAPHPQASAAQAAIPGVHQDAAPLATPSAASIDAAAAAPAAESIVAAVMARVVPALSAAGEPAGRTGSAPIETTKPVQLRPLQGLPTPRALPTEPAGKEATAEGVAAPRPAAAEPPPPVRVHVDWQGQAAHVWLGVDREQLPNLPGLLRQLEQRLQAAGLRLASVTCNGRPVHPRPTSGGEQ